MNKRFFKFRRSNDQIEKWYRSNLVCSFKNLNDIYHKYLYELKLKKGDTISAKKLNLLLLCCIGNVEEEELLGFMDKINKCLENEEEEEENEEEENEEENEEEEESIESNFTDVTVEEKPVIDKDHDDYINMDSKINKIRVKRGLSPLTNKERNERKQSIMKNIK
jgi:hypothetical protein